MIILDNLKTQIETNVDYLKNSGFVNRDAWDLVTKNKFPFFNLVMSSGTSSRVLDMSYDDMERKTYTIEIQFAVGSLDSNKLFKNDDGKTFADLVDDIWNAVLIDETLDSAVDGLSNDDMNWTLNTVEKPGSHYMAGGSIDVTFYKDIAK